MEINVAEGMSIAPNIGVIITLRQGLNQHQTLASGRGKTTEKEWRVFNFLALSCNLSITLIQQSSPAPKPLSGCQDTTHKFTMVTSGIKVGGRAARTGLGVHCGHKTNKNKSFFELLYPAQHNFTHECTHMSANLIRLNCCSVTALLVQPGALVHPLFL